jgi:hypothetical protein
MGAYPCVWAILDSFSLSPVLARQESKDCISKQNQKSNKEEKTENNTECVKHL